MLAKNIITGYVGVRKKKKHNVAKKKIVMVATIGVPLFFSLYLYNLKDNKNLHYTLTLTDDSRKKMGKKTKRVKKKK